MKMINIVEEPQLRFENTLTNINKVEASEKINMISLFSGCGGMDLGFHLSGFNILWANDFDKKACETYAKRR